MASIPASCRRQRGPGARGETECLICQEALSDDTPTIIHHDCNRAMCEECFLSWYRTRGAAATCPNCRAKLQEAVVAPAAGAIDGTTRQPLLTFVQEVAQQRAVRDRRIEASLAALTSLDIVTVLERLVRERSSSWISARPTLEDDLHTAFDSRRAERRLRVEQEIVDIDNEKWDEHRRVRQGRSRRNPAEARDRRERDARKTIRGARREEELQAVFETYNV